MAASDPFLATAATAFKFLATAAAAFKFLGAADHFKFLVPWFAAVGSFKHY